MEVSKMPAYANQRDVVIHKIVNSKNYLTINNDDWMDAFKKLRTGKKGLMVAFGLYLYLARINTNITNWSLSCADVMNKLNISKSSYHRAFNMLVKLGYMRLNEDGTYDVYINKEDHTDIECPICATDDDEDEDDDSFIYETDSPTYETIEDVSYMRQSHIRDNNVPYMTQNSPIYEYSNNINKDNNNKNMGEVIPQTPSSKLTKDKKIVYKTREQINHILSDMKKNGYTWTITDNMYETPTVLIKVIGEDKLEEKPTTPIGVDVFDFI